MSGQDPVLGRGFCIVEPQLRVRVEGGRAEVFEVLTLLGPLQAWQRGILAGALRCEGILRSWVWLNTAV